jgi:hypothetical protein
MRGWTMVMPAAGGQIIIAGITRPTDLSRRRAFCYRCDEVFYVCFSKRNG